MKHILLISLAYLFGQAQPGMAACEVLNSKGQPVSGLEDAVFQVLRSTDQCPMNVGEFRDVLKEEGAIFATTMVANRGFHNPEQGSFSFFEMVTIVKPKHLRRAVSRDELFFGHFTAPGAGSNLTLDQTPSGNSLMIELIAWDAKKELFNFFELRGIEQGPTWFYRGDSADIWSDVEKLHLTKSPSEAIFGNNLRCSGCHIAGGPIMKEFAGPHDSWWMKERVLPLGGRTPDAEMNDVMKSLQSADTIAANVKMGVDKLVAGKAFKVHQQSSPQVALRPLFCPEEIQLGSGLEPLDGLSDDIEIPTSVLLDPRLVQGHLKVSKQLYMNALKSLRSKFPEIERIDGDHPWITPVKSYADQLAVTSLNGFGVDQEFIADVLTIDMTRSVFSNTRCKLLSLVPATWKASWKEEFKQNLASSHLAGAQELLKSLTNPGANVAFYQKQAMQFLGKCQARLKTPQGVLDLVQFVGETRNEAFASDVSKNPRGQILEPGFRVIFSVFNPQLKPGTKTLDSECVLR